MNKLLIDNLVYQNHSKYQPKAIITIFTRNTLDMFLAKSVWGCWGIEKRVSADSLLSRIPCEEALLSLQQKT